MVIEVLRDYPYLLMNLRSVYWNIYLESLNIKADEDNRKAVGMVNGQAGKFWRFSIN